MNLAQIQEEFPTLTGRYDLSGQELTKWINRGVRFLDKLAPLEKKDEFYYIKVNPGTNTVLLTGDCRVLSSVYIMDTERRYHMTEVSVAEIRDFYNTLPVESDRDTSLYYAPITVSVFPEVITSGELSFYSRWGDVLLNNPDEWNGLLLYPQSDREYTLEVCGKFFTRNLVNSEDSNWWTRKYPDLVILAAQYKIQSLQTKNRELKSGLLEDIMTEIKGVVFDQIENELQVESVMEVKTYNV